MATQNELNSYDEISWKTVRNKKKKPCNKLNKRFCVNILLRI